MVCCMKKNSEQLRVLYAVGPENVIEAYQHWKHGEQSPLQVSIPYSSQFYEVCQSLNIQGYVIAQSAIKQVVKDDRFIIKRLPILVNRASSIFYHIHNIWSGLYLLLCAVKFKANVCIASSGITHWFMWRLFSLFGIKVIPSVHCVLWRHFDHQTLGEKLTLKLAASLFSSDCTATLAVSNQIAKQIAELTHSHNQPVHEFIPTYCRQDFDSVKAPNLNASLFRVLFAGRIEHDKGVFDLLEIAKRFQREGLHHIVFDICGDGAAFSELWQEVAYHSLEATFQCHGHCIKPKMRSILSDSHVVIVPTQTKFVEGFNRVVAESVLAGRPVVTSAVCPAISYVRSAVIEVPPNDINAYGDALIDLYSNRLLYEQKRIACLKLQEQFYDADRSWGAKLKSVLVDMQVTHATI
jgi:glycogen synthase